MKKLKKNILILGINYYPEDSAIGLYTTEKAEYLVSKGYDVTVITGFPYYPQWKISESYKNKAYFFKEEINGVKILRSKQYVPKTPTFTRRIFHLVSFTFGNFLSLFRISKPDIVIAIIPFTTSALLGRFLKIRYKAKLWIHIQDFEFDAAIDSGLLNKNRASLIKVLAWLEKKILKKADKISTISYAMISKLKEKTEAPTYYLPNWVDTTLYQNSFKPHKHLLSKKFKILYSGNIGAKQDWVFFERFVKSIQEYDDIEIILVGEGAEKENVLTKIKQFNNIKHYNLVPFKEVPSLLLSADLHILFQKNDVIDTVMPSKLLGMMASGKPSIITGNKNSEVARIYNEFNLGYFFGDNLINDIVECVLRLKQDVSLKNTLGINAKNYVRDNYSKEQVLSKFVHQIEKLYK